MSKVTNSLMDLFPPLKQRLGTVHEPLPLINKVFYQVLFGFYAWHVLLSFLTSCFTYQQVGLTHFSRGPEQVDYRFSGSKATGSDDILRLSL